MMQDRDGIGSATRRTRARRRIGHGRVCECGESAPAALIPKSDPLVCAECQRRQKNQPSVDHHHVAGRANHDLTVPVPVNAHRSVLSEAQYRWPLRTLTNPDGSPLRAAAACIRGLIDMITYLLDELIAWIPTFLERLDEVLTQHVGRRWWKSLRSEWEETRDDQ